MVLVINHVIRSRLNIIHSQGIHSSQHLCQWHDTSNSLNLFCHLLAKSDISIGTRQDLRLECEFGTGKLLVTNSVGKTDKVGHDVPKEIVQHVVGSGGNHTKESSVGVVETEGGDGGGESVVGNLLAHGGGDVLSESGRGGERSEDGAHEGERHGFRIGVRCSFEAEGDGGVAVGVVTDSNVRSNECRLFTSSCNFLSTATRTLDTSQHLLHFLHQLGMISISSSDDGDTGSINSSQQ
mmetsp:Transcript_6971/g.15343  ORF Transcript_6971/g.15343 Transcript_6971/m.15343 type:complete len:238 (-) Transcript_6971:590-1303(-)